MSKSKETAQTNPADDAAAKAAAEKEAAEAQARADAEAKAKADADAAAAAKVPKLIKMNRSEPVHPGGPVTADVHPDEVENWYAGGWRPAE